MELFTELSDKVAGKDIRIVYPEATDKRVLGAAVRLKADQLIEPILLGDREEILSVAEANKWSIEDMVIVDPKHYEEKDAMIDALVERRQGKNTREECEQMLEDIVYFGTMLVYLGEAAGLVCGAVNSTSATVRPALQIIKTKPGVKLTSGAFLMLPPEDNGKRFIFSDCAINIDPDAQSLAEIAVESAKTAELFDIDPKVAMLSFSTKGSGAGPQVDKVVEATRIAKELAPELALDGELQFDAAYSMSVAQQKAPDSQVAGAANVFIFPDLQAGNIGYKIAQRFGNYAAIGPILQGLNKPISDLSRGCDEEDVYRLSLITANQALMGK